jgi:hypothetical protein
LYTAYLENDHDGGFEARAKRMNAIGIGLKREMGRRGRERKKGVQEPWP